ncbi:MAG TPA: 3-oxoacyl-[acyl-carrier-protein] synthase III C-terminal domain-containing protein [Thermoanaerobaculia bacterium]|nr:3-oxoacyl-[acyl-carrier-protein] synthase III C-terminal domain-containing protein [Thermoanaerobaculia bacterium]
MSDAPSSAGAATGIRTVVRGSGIYPAESVVTNDRLSRLMDTTDEWIAQRTGIRERRFARKGTSSADLGIEAARRALEDARLGPADIDFIVFATMTPAHYFPGNGGLLAAGLGLATTPALDIRMQCAGFLSGLQVADAYIRSGAARRVLLVGAECHAAFFPWTEADWAILFGDSDASPSDASYAWGTAHRDRAVIFGDGAGAFVLEASEASDGRGFLGFEMRTDGTQWDKLYVPGGGSASFPYFSPAMFADNGTIPIVEGRQVFRLATTALPQIVREILERHGLRLADLDLLLMHQANLRINEAVQKALGLPDEKVYNNIQKYGNTTAATLPLVFHEARREGRVRAGDLVVFAALGAGLHWGAGLLRV